MKSVDKMREHLFGKFHFSVDQNRYIKEMLDAVEAEVGENYVALPKGRDEKPIKPGETVYGEDGKEWHVEDIRLARKHSVIATNGDDRRGLMPEWLSHDPEPSLHYLLKDALDEAVKRVAFNGMSASEAIGMAVKKLEPKLELRKQ